MSDTVARHRPDDPREDRPHPNAAPPAGEGITAGKRPWKQAALWLACLAPFFYLSYGFANYLATQRSDVPSVVFAWEHQIPFLAWTIFPYWSINVFYGLSLFLCRTRDQVHTHGKRLLTAQLIAVSCFLLFPLGFSFGQPHADGAPGVLFAALRGFDKPFNQAPSLHIALVVILWDLYRRLIPSAWQWLLHMWALAIAVSVLTTYQHHFIDIPTGALLGLFCLWLWPLDGVNPLRNATITQDRKRLRLAAYYAVGAFLCFLFAAIAYAWIDYPGIGGIALWLCWPGVALGFVAANYIYFGAHGFQKDAQGRISIAARWLLAPYRWGAWLNSRLWTRGQAQAVQVGLPARIDRDIDRNGEDPRVENILHEGTLPENTLVEGILLENRPLQSRLWLGRMPTAGQARALGLAALVDVCAELPAPASVPARSVPMLDLIPAHSDTLFVAAEAIQTQLDATEDQQGAVLVCCALGYSRSAAAVAAWMLRYGHAENVDVAIAHLRAARPQLVLHEAHRRALAALVATSRAATP
jgi:hypothetical protein